MAKNPHNPEVALREAAAEFAAALNAPVTDQRDSGFRRVNAKLLGAAIRYAAFAAGRRGGKVTSEAKTKAARKNAKLGGWPKGRKRNEVKP